MTKAATVRIEFLEGDFSVCQVRDLAGVKTAAASAYCFMAKTPDEFSLVCPTENVPADTLKRDDGWCAFRVAGQLDFALVGILAGIAGTLAERGVSIFAVSSYDTDYVLIRRDRAGDAKDALAGAGYELV